MDKPPLIVIVGPTAVGKSKLAVELASELDGEIVSADSMQIYRGMDIGTAKLKEKDMVASNGIFIKHYLIDIIDPEEDFSVADFQRLARAKISEIYNRGKLPFLVGGTGLYINAVIDKYNFQKEAVDRNLRKSLWQKIEEKGNEHLYKELIKVDPATAERIHPNDKKRIIRALEYYYTVGKPISRSREEKKESIYNLVMIGLYCKRELLYKRIDKRVDLMLKRGLVDEVKNLINRGMPLHKNAMQALGYKHIALYLNGKLSFEEAVNKLKRDTRRYAKRQMTWFKRDNRIIWFEVKKEYELFEIVTEIMAMIGRIINI